MSRELVGPLERQDIDSQVDRLLRDLGYPEPPLKLEMVRELLRLDLQYYTTSKSSFFDDLQHRIRVGSKQIRARPGLIFDTIKKLNLSGLWVPDTKRIFIDENVPKRKHRWIEAHEINHGIIEWHEDFLFGDNKLTLTRSCDIAIEAEANYGAGRLLFLGERFREEILSSPLTFDSLKAHSKNYGNSLQSTLWRAVEEYAPDRPVFGMISVHPRHPDIGAKEFADAPRLIRSQRFREQFANVTPDIAYQVLEKHARWNRGGPIVDAEEPLPDLNGDAHEFRIESFSTTHALLTFGITPP